MLNCDYKIFARTIARRLEGVIDQLVDTQQTGFIKGRSIEENIMTTMEIIAHTRKNKEAAVIMMVDFSKCFDRISHKAIKGVLRFFNFGDQFIRNVMLLYTDFELCTQNNGYTSRFLSKNRGINQGCNASPLIYTLCGEVLALLLKNNDKIHGITVNQVLKILTQFADDTTMYLRYDPITLHEVGDTLVKIEKNLGLMVSYEKTCLYRVGTLAGTDAQVYTQKNYLWSNEPMDTLGVKLDCSDNSQVIELNYKNVRDKLLNICNDWYNRSLSLIGKVQVVNTLMASLFVYKMSVMLNMSAAMISEMELILRRFIWTGKRDKIPLRILQLDHKQGGLRLVNLTARQCAFKCKWIYRLDNSPFLRECAFQELSPILREDIWLCNLRNMDVNSIFGGGNSFWAQVLLAWSNINFWTPETDTQILDQRIWYNSHIRANNKPFIIQSAYVAGIIKLRDIWDENSNSFLQLAEVHDRYGECMTWLTYNMIKAAVPKEWKSVLREGTESHEGHLEMYIALGSVRNVTRDVYDLLIDNEIAILKYWEKWIKAGLLIAENEYVILFQELKRNIKDTKLYSFQYRLLLNKIFTNNTLYKWGVVTGDKCTFCKNVTETPIHLLWECTVSQQIWNNVSCWANESDIECNWNVSNVIFSTVHESHVHIINFVTVVVKQYLYSCKCQDKTPSVKGARERILLQKNLELYNCNVLNKKKAVYKKWYPLYPELIV